MTEPALQAQLTRRGLGRDELRHIIAMSVPIVITTSARAVMDFTDYWMVKYLHSPEAQAAMLPAQMLMFTCICFGMGVVSMVNTFAAQCLGQKRLEEAGAYGWQVVYLSAFFGVLSFVLLPVVPWAFRLIGHDAEVQRLEIAYAEIALLTMGPSIASAGLGHFFNGLHRPWVTTITSLEAIVVNVLVTGALMLGWFGVEPIGIAGAAWGTLVAVIYRTARLMIELLSPRMAREYATRRMWRPSRTRIMNLLWIGLPSGLQWVSDLLVWMIFISLLIGREFGTAQLIATNTAWQYMRVAFMPPMGVGIAMTSIVGKCVGAGDPESAIRFTRIGAIMTLAYMGSLSLVYALFGGLLIGYFNTDAEVMRIGAQVMICCAVFQVFDALAITYNGALRGVGDTFWPSIVFVVSTWLVVIGGGYAMIELFPGLESIGPWIAASTLISLSSVYLWWRWHSRRWMKINIFRSKPADTPQAAPAESDAGDVELAGVLRE